MQQLRGEVATSLLLLLVLEMLVFSEPTSAVFTEGR
jgi:hypothetical protein